MTSVKVAVRVRPLNKRELDLGCNFIIQMNDKKTTISNNKIPEGSLDGVSESTKESMRHKDFTFDFSFWTVDAADKARYHDQEMVYNNLGVDVVDSGYEGYNACVFAYGQTGSGKTYTMMGPPDDPGLIPRICKELFHRMTDEATSYRAEVSYLEIYNEKVRDLLKTTEGGSHNLRVREHPKEGPYVQSLSKYVVGTFTEILGLMQKGNSVRHRHPANNMMMQLSQTLVKLKDNLEVYRTTASTNMNDVSSRSHAIFTIVFTQATIKDGIPSEKTSKIHLVDLAGSERATATGATGQRLREGGSINKSLVSLGTVIKQLAEVSEKGHKAGKGNFIPYRDSVLTWLLKDSLGGNARTIMVTAISPADVNYAETLSALRYANRAKNIINRPTVNEDQNVKIIRELREEIERLKTMVGGDIDSISKPRVKEKLHESEARMKVLTEEWSEKWKDIAAILREQGTLALRKEGRGVVLDSALPHLIGIDDDILSTGIKFFHLKEGITRIGTSEADPPVDIVIAGQEVETDHCTIEFQDTTVTLIPSQDSLCCVNGNQVLEPTKLTQGAVVLLGKTNMFRYNNPAEAAQMKKELEKTGLSFKRTSLISQSMTDLYKSSENISTMNGSTFELHHSHREEHEKIEELRTQIKVLEDRYHTDEEERINHQVALEMELEKKQKLLNRAYKDLNKVQQDILEVHHSDKVLTKLPKGTEIDEMLKKLDEQENSVQEASRITRDSLMEKLESVTVENEQFKTQIQDRVGALDERERLKDTEIKLLQDELTVKQQTANEQDEEDQKVIDVEQQQLDKLCKEFDIMFHSKLAEDESLQKKFQDIEKQRGEIKEKFETKESAMKEKWKVDLDEIAAENKEIEEAWNDIKDQERDYEECLRSDKLSVEEISEIEAEMSQLHVAKGLLKLEENKVAVKERMVLDAIEQEMEKFEEEKKGEEAKIETLSKGLSRECGSSDLNQLGSKIEEKQRNIEGLVGELQKQSGKIKELEQTIDQKKRELIAEKAEIAKEKEEMNSNMCQTVIKLEKDIIAINEEIESVDTKLNEELIHIQEERQSLLLLKKSQNTSPAPIDILEGDEEDVERRLQALSLSEEENIKMQQKKQELEALQAAVDKANEELEDKVRHYDQARDYELDVIELEKESLTERVRQDRINILVEQEVKRRMFEEKIQRENKHQMERDQEKRDREEEIKRLKEAHNREIKELKARYEKRANSMNNLQAPTQSNPYTSVMSQDGEDIPRRKSTGNLALVQENLPTIHVTIPMFRLQSYGSDTHYEYEVKIVVGEDVWSIMRRYSRFREFHQKLKNKFPEIGALVFPPKKFFSKTDRVSAERQIQLEFYLRSVIEICTRTPSCYLHPSQNQFLSKQVLCDFDPFFRKGLFEPSKEWWRFQEVGHS